MRITFDSNAWEAVFCQANIRLNPIRAALDEERIAGFICAAAFRIEAITKRNRAAYFSQPYMGVSVEIMGLEEPGRLQLAMSIAPDNGKHPGIPNIQIEKLARAVYAGVKLMHGQNWMGLPVPREIKDSTLYVSETREAASARERRQIMVSSMIDERGVGHAAFVAADGWTDRCRTPAEEKELSRACAEWSDGELVAAHIAYGNDILCSNDYGRATGHSIFNGPNRAWLAESYGVTFMTVEELMESVSV